jgi:hypothetical protein
MRNASAVRASARAAIVALLATEAEVLHAQVRVVNMIPAMFGDETTWNPEPTLAVHPTDRSLLAASSFLVGTDVCEGRTLSPMLVSRDTGKTWSVVCNIPTPGLAGLPPQDVVMRWGSRGRRLYAAFIWSLPGHPQSLQVFSTNDVFSPRPMQFLVGHDTVDQPDLLVIDRKGHDRVMVAGSYKDSLPRTAAILWADDPTGPTQFKRIDLEHRKIGEQDFAVRLDAHASGRIYALYDAVPFEYKGNNTTFLDIVVARDDAGGASTNPFAALREKPRPSSPANCPIGDGRPGVRVVRCRPYAYDGWGAVRDTFGFQRRVPVQLSVATDPTDKRGNTVYVAWADSSGSDHQRVTVAKSVDGGQGWRLLLSIPNAMNPSVAVDSLGRLGFLFQQLAYDSVANRWVTRLLVTRDDMQHAREYVLATTPALLDLVRMQPYIGDWAELHARGSEFLGVFSAANIPDSANFPNGVVYQRRVSFADRMLLVRRPVDDSLRVDQLAPSIDPFFFRVGPAESPRCLTLRRSVPAGTTPPSLIALPREISDSTRRRMSQIGCDR